MRSCPECGAAVGSRMNFCSECGARLAVSQSTVAFSPGFYEEEEEAAEYIPDTAALIELDQVEGTAGRRMHDIGTDLMTVGRSQKSDIVLDDVTVSREHAEILKGHKSFRIRDSGSLNGTYVNRVRVDSVDLRNGDEIQVGKYRFKFVLT